jgi:hypothetical protein
MAMLLSLGLLLVPAGIWSDAHARLAVSYPLGWHLTTAN